MNKNTIELIECPAGKIKIGNTTHDIAPFAIGKYPITQQQYEEVMGINPSYFANKPNNPVETVSWIDAKEFCAKLTERHRAEGILAPDEEYTLPSDEEWEYAARAGGEEPLVYGPILDIGWFWENTDHQTQPVGQKLPNKWGIHDMLGNVWEWCRTEFKCD